MFAILFCLFAPMLTWAKPPRLVVGIVVDQMRYDYLSKYDPLFGPDGFRKLQRQGHVFTDARFNYQPTVTAVGHATIYTGAMPAVHGISENNYFDKDIGKVVYVMEDPAVVPVGSNTGRCSSPHRLRSTTITDELKLRHPSSKIISIAIKDRGALLPAGHKADGAFFFDERSGKWITSSWYAERLPDWLQQWNERDQNRKYLSEPWNLLLPRSAYAMCTSDSTAYERAPAGKPWATFPHFIQADDWKSFTASPFANTLTKDLAKEAIVRENLGRDDVTDFLCISFSATDIIGHAYGIHSLELADCYARLDRDLADLLSFLDKQIGKKNILVFLTSDHGAAVNPLFAEDQQMPGGRLEADTWLATANQFLGQRFDGTPLVAAIMEQQLYFNDSLMSAMGIAYHEVAAAATEFLLKQPGVLCTVVPKAGLSTCPPMVETALRNGWVPDRSGDVIFALRPGWIDWPHDYGTTHLTVHAYDQHMPLIWFGWKVRRGLTHRPTCMTEIAPTLALILNLPLPSGCQSHPLSLPLKK